MLNNICSEFTGSCVSILYVLDNCLCYIPSVPTLFVEIQPTQIVALEVAPYNSFILECNASTHETVVVPKLFQWIELEGDDERNLTDNGDTVVISYNDLEKPQSISSLSVSERMMGIYVYNCTTTMHFPGGLTVAAFVIADVTIQGKFNQHCLFKVTTQWCVAK